MASPKTGKISIIPKDYTNAFPSIDTSLRRKGYSRTPGTGYTVLPYKERNGFYRTGMDPDAIYIERMRSEEERDVEKARAAKELEELQRLTRLNLSPQSPFYNFAAPVPDEQKVGPITLVDGDNLFNLEEPMQRIAWNWLRVHPRIASSHQAYIRGDYPADTQFFVCDDDVETGVEFKKKSLINKAIVTFQDMAPDKKKKIARLMGLPVSESTKEEVVYNLMDGMLKEQQIKDGQHKGENSVNLFNKLSIMDEKILNVKDLVEQAIRHSVYRVRAGGRIFEGENEVAIDRTDLVKYLMDDDHQMDLLALQDKLKVKKIVRS